MDWQAYHLVEVHPDFSLLESFGQLRDSLKELVSEGKTNIILDMTKVHEIRSPGLGELISASKVVRKAEGHLKIIGVGEKVYSALCSAQLDKALELHLKPSKHRPLEGW